MRAIGCVQANANLLVMKCSLDEGAAVCTICSAPADWH